MKKSEQFAALNQVHIETCRGMEDVADYYGLPRGEIEERHWQKAKLVLRAAELGKKAIESLRMSCSVKAYYLKKIPGPQEPSRLEKQAKKADSLANSLEKFGKDDDAVRQRARADGLRTKAASLRDNKPAPREKRLKVRGTTSKAVADSVRRRAAKAFKAVRATRRLFRTF
jgi:hypothetical protein